MRNWVIKLVQLKKTLIYQLIVKRKIKKQWVSLSSRTKKWPGRLNLWEWNCKSQDPIQECSPLRAQLALFPVKLKIIIRPMPLLTSLRCPTQPIYLKKKDIRLFLPKSLQMLTLCLPGVSINKVRMGLRSRKRVINNQLRNLKLSLTLIIIKRMPPLLRIVTEAVSLGTLSLNLKCLPCLQWLQC